MYEKKQNEMDKSILEGLHLEMWLVDKHIGHSQSTSQT